MAENVCRWSQVSPAMNNGGSDAMNRAALGLAIAIGSAACASAQPPKTPALPPINPAQARLDQTLGGLDGPCYALAVGENAEVLIAAGERGTLLAWPRSTWM